MNPEITQRKYIFKMKDSKKKKYHTWAIIRDFGTYHICAKPSI